MGAKFKSLGGWWMVPLLSVASLAAPNSDLRLVDAVQRGDKEAVRSLLKQHADVNAPQADGATALAWAAHWDDLETADLLIHAGANVNAANDYGVTPLSLACSNGNAAMVEKLLKAGADPNATLWTGETALMTAARTGNVDVVKLLLAHGAEVNAKETRRGQTALMWSVAQNHPEVARALIEHGADVHARSKASFTPLLALTYGADVPTSSKGGFTPLLFAAQQGDLDLARMLLAAGANVNAATPEDGSALVVASAGGHESLAIFLLEKGADPNLADGNGITALHYAMQKGISILSGVQSKNKYYETYMFRPNMEGLVKALLPHGANPNVRMLQAPPRLRLLFRPRISLDGATPFLLAAATGDISLMRTLATRGADPLLATKENVTPLMVAAGMGRFENRTDEERRSALEAIKLVVELGADVNAANTSGPRIGQTALHAAAFTGTNATIQFLVDKGAQVNVQDRCGQTPLSIAEGDPAGLVDSLDRARVPKATADLLRKLGAGDTPPTAPAANCAEEGGINSRYRKIKVNPTIAGAN